MELESYLQLSKELAQLKKLYEIGAFTFTSTHGYLGYQIEQKKSVEINHFQ